jgi:hypothetical protein
MKNKNTYITIGIILLVLIATGGLFSLVGASNTKLECQNYVKNNYCSSGSYKCEDCTATPGYVSLYQANCGLRGSNTANAITNDYCALSSNIKSHSFYRCYDNDVYWYNSNTVREEKKLECGTAGCQDETLNTAWCRTPPADQTVGKMCMDANNLCNNAILSGNSYLCDLSNTVQCSWGCDSSAKACKSPPATNCVPNSIECVTEQQFKLCNFNPLYNPLSGNSAYAWQTFACPSNTACDNTLSSGNVCKTLTPVNKCIGVTCGADSECNSLTGACDLKKCSPACGDGFVCNTQTQTCDSIDICAGINCDNGQQCYNGACVAVACNPTCDGNSLCIAGKCVPVASKCSGVTCQNSCIGSNLNKEGKCNELTGTCDFSVSINDPTCVAPQKQSLWDKIWNWIKGLFSY